MVATSSHTPFGLKKSYRATFGERLRGRVATTSEAHPQKAAMGRHSDEITPRCRAADWQATRVRERSPKVARFLPNALWNQTSWVAAGEPASVKEDLARPQERARYRQRARYCGRAGFDFLEKP